MPASSRAVRAEADAEDGSAQSSRQHAAADPRRNAVTDMTISWEPEPDQGPGIDVQRIPSPSFDQSRVRRDGRQPTGHFRRTTVKAAGSCSKSYRNGFDLPRSG